MNTVSFTEMRHGSADDYRLLEVVERRHGAGLADRLTEALQRLDGGLDGYQVSRLQHSLQTATRAQDAGADTEMIVGALLHDLGDELAPENHSQLAAAIIRPYVRAEVTWVVEMHGLFQLAHYGHHRGLDPNARDAYRGNPFFEACALFCDNWDQASFDPGYPTRQLADFGPLLREVFARQPFDPATG